MKKEFIIVTTMKNLNNDSDSTERLTLACLLLFLFDRHYHDLLSFIQLVVNWVVSLAKMLFEQF